MDEIEKAYRDTLAGRPANQPGILLICNIICEVHNCQYCFKFIVIEMTIPSALDNTLAPPGKHVVQLFVQYAPYDLDPSIGSWSDESFKLAFAHRCFSIIDKFCPGFSNSILHMDILSPLDLERIFGLYKGNIFHGALGLNQLGYMRPAPGKNSEVIYKVKI
jgi:phytoene dehydrogenase-like protein